MTDNYPQSLLLKQASDLVSNLKNPRKHSKEHIAEIKASIQEFGWTNPILIKGDIVVAGHARLKAARELKLEQVPCVDVGRMSDTQALAYLHADNQLAMKSSWDYGLLRENLTELEADGFDLDLLGFSQDELDEIMKQAEVDLNLIEDGDSVPDVKAEATTKRGDIWELGNHRLMCGDSVSIDDVEKLIALHKIDAVYTDPPYGVSIVGKDGKVGARGNYYEEIIGDDSIQTAVDSYNLCASLDIPVQIFWGGNYYASHLPDSPAWIIWDKDNGDTSFADCELAWTNQKIASRIFKHQWNGYVKESERGEKRCHPTQKPIALAEWCLEKYAPKKKNVLDLFGGSGSTLIACEKTNRNCFMMELSENYCDVIIERWEKVTGKKAALTGG